MSAETDVVAKRVASGVFYLLPQCVAMQTKGEMRRKCNSFSDLDGQLRLYDDQYMDTLQDHIEMNPNGCDALSLQRHSDCYRAWPSSQTSLLLLRQHNFKLKVYYTSVDNCVHCNKR